jgi:hypothetical protein
MRRNEPNTFIHLIAVPQNRKYIGIHESMRRSSGSFSLPLTPSSSFVGGFDPKPAFISRLIVSNLLSFTPVSTQSGRAYLNYRAHDCFGATKKKYMRLRSSSSSLGFYTISARCIHSRPSSLSWDCRNGHSECGSGRI